MVIIHYGAFAILYGIPSTMATQNIQLVSRPYIK